jgi:DNA-directed RNA polymerase specialized sigma24 family protein
VPLLNQPWALHDVADVEALLVKVVRHSPFAGKLTRDDRDDLLCWLFEVAWKLSLAFDRDRGSFSGFLYSSARLQAIEWQRRRYRTVWKFRDRTYTRPRVDLVSLNGTGDSLAESLAAIDRDLEDGGGPACSGLLANGDSTRARDLGVLGLGPAP